MSGQGTIPGVKNTPFIPLNRVKQVAPKPKVKPRTFICIRNHKKLKKMGIMLNQEVVLELGRINMVRFYNSEIKGISHASLSPKLFKKFKEVK